MTPFQFSDFGSFEKNCQSLEQFRQALENAKPIRTINDSIKFVICSEELDYSDLNRKYKQIERSNWKGKEKEIIDLFHQLGKLKRRSEERLQTEEEIEEALDFFESIKLKVQSDVEELRQNAEDDPPEVRENKMVMIEIFEHTFCTQLRENLGIGQVVDHYDYISWKNDAVEAIYNSDSKKLMNIVRNLNQKIIDAFPFEDKFYQCDPHKDKLVAIQKKKPEFFLNLLLPEEMCGHDLPVTLQVLRKNPIHYELMIDYFEALQNRPELTLVDFFTYLPGFCFYPAIQELMDAGMTFNCESIINCIHMPNKALDLLIQAPHAKDLIKKHSKAILTELLYCNDISAAEKLYVKGLDLSSALFLLDKNMGNCEHEIVSWLIQKGMSSSDQQVYERILQLAVDNKNLTIIRVLSEKLGGPSITKISYPEILKIDSFNAEELLKGFILCSPLEEVYALSKALKLQDLAAELLKRASLFVRFPKEGFRKQLDEALKNTDTYVENSWKYAENNFQFIEKTKDELNKLSCQELLWKIATHRYNHMSTPDIEYLSENRPYATPIESGFFRNPNRFPSRYEPALKYLLNRVADKEIELDIFNNHHLFTYSIPETKETIEMTMLHFNYPLSYIVQWIHSPPKNLPSLKPHVDKLHKEIIDYDLKEGSKAELVDKIAHCYWLIATMVQFSRGTPHNAMMWLNLVYAHHGLTPPIPKLEAFFLDNRALMLSVVEFAKHFKTFLEPEFVNEKQH